MSNTLQIMDGAQWILDVKLVIIITITFIIIIAIITLVQLDIKNKIIKYAAIITSQD